MIIRLTLSAVLFCVLSNALFSQEEDDDEKSTPWTAAAVVRYLNRYTSYGVELSGDRPAVAPSLSLSHEGGFSSSVEGIVTSGAGGGLQRWAFGVGYDFSLSEQFILSIAFNRYGYRNDTANVLAGLSNSLSVSAEIDLDVINVSVSVDQYLGNGGATYFGADVSSFLQFDNWTIVPLAQVTFVSQTVSISRTRQHRLQGAPKRGPGGTTTTTTTLAGLSSMSLHTVAIYRVTENFSLVIHPSFLYSPLSEISSRSTQFNWSAGIRYSVPF
jgi:hypothetical protein